MIAIPETHGPCLQDSFCRNMRQTGSILLQTGRQEDKIREFARSVAAGLAARPRKLDCRFLYDTPGSALFEDICRQPEYYQTRTEAAILARHAAEIRAATGPVLLFELGAGCASKTGCLVRAYHDDTLPLIYAPVDVSESALRRADSNIRSRWPAVQVIGIHGTYEDAFPLFRRTARAMVVFLGSTIGNLDDEEADGFWQTISTHLKTGDYFLLGVDLVKDQNMLEAAYNDRAGVTEAFTKNLFCRMNRELGSEIEPDRVEHVARYNAQYRRIEIYARFSSDQAIHVRPLGRSFTIRAGEEILVEISRKFELDSLPAYFNRFGFSVTRTFTDARDWFALLLLQKDTGHDLLS